jgi:hypothetical protein
MLCFEILARIVLALTEFHASPFRPSPLAKFVAPFLDHGQRGKREPGLDLVLVRDAIHSSHLRVVLLRVAHLCEVCPVSMIRSPASKKRRYAGDTVDISAARFSPC